VQAHRPWNSAELAGPDISIELAEAEISAVTLLVQTTDRRTVQAHRPWNSAELAEAEISVVTLLVQNVN
jgi:hypothetical protein